MRPVVIMAAYLQKFEYDKPNSKTPKYVTQPFFDRISQLFYIGTIEKPKIAISSRPITCQIQSYLPICSKFNATSLETSVPDLNLFSLTLVNTHVATFSGSVKPIN